MSAESDLQETFWLQTQADSKMHQVSKEAWVKAERSAGFYNKHGSNSEPATGSFSHTDRNGTIRGTIKYSSTEIASEFSNSSIDSESLHRPLYAVRWMEHEYEPGWGVDDGEAFISLHTDIEHAKSSVELQFKEKGRSLYGAGDYFIYPSGANHTYEIYELPALKDSKIFDAIDEDGLNIPNRPANESVQEFRKQLINMLQSDKVQTHVIDFQGLAPKPMTSAPVTIFPETSSFDDVTKKLQFN